MSENNRHSFTLIEVLVVIVIIGILSAIAIPNFNKTKYNVLSKEAVSNIRLIAAAEKIYKMESDEDVYDSCDNTAECNDTLKLDLNDSNWVYSVKTTSTPLSVATIKAELKGNLNCTYTLTSSDFNADPEKSRNCPDGMI